MQFDLIEKNLSCATIPNFLYKVAYNSEAIIISCVVFVIWNQSLSHVAGKRKNKQPVFLNPLPLDICTGKFTDWFSLGSSYCDQAFPQLNSRSQEGSREARESLTKCLSKATAGSILAFILAACSVLESDSQEGKTELDKGFTKG